MLAAKFKDLIRSTNQDLAFQLAKSQNQIPLFVATYIEHWKNNVSLAKDICHIGNGYILRVQINQAYFYGDKLGWEFTQVAFVTNHPRDKHFFSMKKNLEMDHFPLEYSYLQSDDDSSKVCHYLLGLYEISVEGEVVSKGLDTPFGVFCKKIKEISYE